MLSRSLIALVCASTVAALVGCGSQEAPAEPGDRYQARGVVRQLPQPPGQELYIHHEAIPTFKNMDGEVEGMGAMAMPFPIDAAPVPEGLKVGDKVSFEFEVNWTGSPPMRLLSLEVLPADTLLEFERPADGPTDAESESQELPEGAHGDHEHGGLGHGGGDTNSGDTHSGVTHSGVTNAEEAPAHEHGSPSG